MVFWTKKPPTFPDVPEAGDNIDRSRGRKKTIPARISLLGSSTRNVDVYWDLAQEGTGTIHRRKPGIRFSFDMENLFNIGLPLFPSHLLIIDYRKVL